MSLSQVHHGRAAADRKGLRQGSPRVPRSEEKPCFLLFGVYLLPVINILLPDLCVCDRPTCGRWPVVKRRFLQASPTRRRLFLATCRRSMTFTTSKAWVNCFCCSIFAKQLEKGNRFFSWQNIAYHVFSHLLFSYSAWKHPISGGGGFFFTESLRFGLTDSSWTYLASWWKSFESYLSLQHPEISVLVSQGNFVLFHLLRLDFSGRSNLR